MTDIERQRQKRAIRDLLAPLVKASDLDWMTESCPSESDALSYLLALKRAAAKEEAKAAQAEADADAVEHARSEFRSIE